MENEMDKIAEKLDDVATEIHELHEPIFTVTRKLKSLKKALVLAILVTKNADAPLEEVNALAEKICRLSDDEESARNK